MEKGERNLVIRYHPASRVFISQSQVSVPLGQFKKTAVNIEVIPDANAGSPRNSAVNAAHTLFHRRSSPYGRPRYFTATV